MSEDISLSIHLSKLELDLLIASIGNVRQFVPDWEFGAVMGVQKADLDPLFTRLIAAREELERE